MTEVMLDSGVLVLIARKYLEIKQQLVKKQDGKPSQRTEGSEHLKSTRKLSNIKMTIGEQRLSLVN